MLLQNCRKDDQWRARSGCHRYLLYKCCWAIYPTYLSVCKKKGGHTLTSAPQCVIPLVIGGRMQRCLCSSWNIHEHNKSIHGLRVPILDGHHSHITQEAINGACAHGITLITLPPHITHKMWPLDRTWFTQKINFKIPRLFPDQSKNIVTFTMASNIQSPTAVHAYQFII